MTAHAPPSAGQPYLIEGLGRGEGLLGRGGDSWGEGEALGEGGAGAGEGPGPGPGPGPGVGAAHTRTPGGVRVRAGRQDGAEPPFKAAWRAGAPLQGAATGERRNQER